MYTEVQDGFRSGFVTLIGRPNAGKSTLVNTLIGHKVAITSNKPQTTRHRLRAIYDTDEFQMVLVDTPGLHKPQDALGEELNYSTEKALEDVDVVCLLVDASKPVGSGDAWVANLVKGMRTPKIGVLTKTSLVDDKTVAEQLDALSKLASFDDICALSALEGKGLASFTDCVCSHLPEGPRWFPADMDTDQPLEVLIAEFIREKILTSTRDELPYSIGVQVEEMRYVELKDTYEIYAVIYVERDSQKGIIIGKGGQMIKHIGTEARKDLKRLLGCKVRLDLNVKVKKGWRRDATQVRKFGYGEGL